MQFIIPRCRLTGSAVLNVTLQTMIHLQSQTSKIVPLPSSLPSQEPHKQSSRFICPAALSPVDKILSCLKNTQRSQINMKILFFPFSVTLSSAETQLSVLAVKVTDSRDLVVSHFLSILNPRISHKTTTVGLFQSCLRPNFSRQGTVGQNPPKQVPSLNFVSI